MTIDEANALIVTDAGLRPEQWRWLAEQLQRRPAWVAEQLQMPSLAGYRGEVVEPLRITTITDRYRSDNGSTDKGKQEAVKPLERLTTHAGARTLADLTTEKLLAWKREIERTVPGPATRRAYYSRVRTVVSFGMKAGLDAAQIREFLDRAKVLWTSEPLPPVNPQPISRTHFHKLLQAGGEKWRPWLLAGLNLCLHLEEVCALKWEYLDLQSGTYAAVRHKTRRQRIPRAATLWNETLDTLRSLKRTGNPHVFISAHGDRYNRNTRGNDFAELRTAAGVPASVTFDALRDGAYTAACRADGVDDKYARLLAGQKAYGLQDNYVLRSPDIVKPACDAVYRHYGPFPIDLSQ